MMAGRIGFNNSPTIDATGRVHRAPPNVVFKPAAATGLDSKKADPGGRLEKLGYTAMNVEDKSREICSKLHLPEDGPAFVAIRLALKEQDRDTRHACAEAIITHSHEVAKANTYRGRVNQIAEFACEQLDKAHGICINTRAV